MISIKIFRKNQKVVGYSAKGHSGYDEIGKDIVCAAVSIIMQNPLGGMEDVLKVTPKYVINDDGYLEVNIKDMDTQGKDKEIETLLETMVIMTKALEVEYPKYIKLVEKEVK